MREILFRGRSIDTGEWLCGDLTHHGDNDNRAQIWYLDEDGERYNAMVYLHTVGQFTGLTDKNGEKIFEGDIIARKRGMTTAAIMWDDCRKQFMAKETGGRENDIDFYFPHDGKTIEDAEIIGDIYERGAEL